jgi:acetate kinase
MTGNKRFVLALNGGSSSIKFALYEAGDPPRRTLHGKVDGIGVPGTTLMFDGPGCNAPDQRAIGDLDHGSAAGLLIDWLAGQIGLASLTAVGHRVINLSPTAKMNEPASEYRMPARSDALSTIAVRPRWPDRRPIA